ncbi:hypothetical protein GCM10009834_37220 [Streptomonospora arabica]
MVTAGPLRWAVCVEPRRTGAGKREKRPPVRAAAGLSWEIAYLQAPPRSGATTVGGRVRFAWGRA